MQLRLKSPSLPRSLLARPQGRTRRELWLAPAALVVALLLWEGLVRWRNYPSFILPSPGLVAQRFLAAAGDGTLWYHTRITVLEIFGGLLLGLTAATVLGYLIAKSPTLERVLSPYLVASQAIPIVALAPLLVIWIRSPGLSKVLICALTIFFPALINTVVGIRSVEPDLMALMRSLQATRWQILTKLEIPAALPVLLGGLKIGVTLAVIGAVVAEFVGADRGLGFLINLSRGILDTPLLFVALAALVMIAVLLYGAVSWLEHRLLAWQRIR
ncbi:MAG: ABC transporter permease [Caldilineales bacterium]|nr:ABC transporter permease [Caldilineales bacterium]MDW8317419.1 ABC transporter permease [Anaerolineae bacterium]